MDKLGTCLTCGHVNPRGNSFCQQCGVSLTGEPNPPSQFAAPPPYAPPAYGAPRRNAALPWIIAAVVTCAAVVLVGAMALVALPNYTKVKEKAKEAEVKANLHNIQLSIERFAVDNGGLYPEYLIGGEAKCAKLITQTVSGDAFQSIVDCTRTEGVSDPLIRMGYFDSYPRNPFTKNGIAIHQVQRSLPSVVTLEDPLRNGTSTGESLGTRFGAYCTAMGSVLADNRYPAFSWHDPTSGMGSEVESWANIEYPFWDLWTGSKSLPFLPGQFFYKSTGPIDSKGGKDDAANPIAPTKCDSYMLSGYGGIRTEGKDVLGDEQQTWLRGADGSPAGQVWPWTRSAVANDSQSLGGSPYCPGNPASGQQFEYGNPNGIRDAIILVLTAGEDYL